MELTSLKSTIIQATLALVLGLPSLAFSSETIPYRILNKTALPPFKLSMDIEVPLINGKPPTIMELGALSKHLVGKERKYDRAFVLFYLPGMKVGAGAYASAHHNPIMEVKVFRYSLIEHPEYHVFIPEIIEALDRSHSDYPSPH